MSGSLSAIDGFVICAYLVGVIGLGLWAARRQKTAEGYFLASRGSRWPTVGLALLASNISSTTLVGLAGAAYAIGISTYNYEWMAAVVLVIFCAFFLPAILASRVYTMPEFLERRYGPSIRYYFSALTLFLNIVVDTAGTLFGGSLMFRMIFPHVPVWEIAAGLALLAGVYTALGGLKAVLVTEVVQAVVLIGASVFISTFAFDRAGGLAHVLASVPHEKVSLIRPPGDPGVPWTGLITGIPITGFYFWCTNQFMVQRVLSARSLDDGRWGCLLAGLLKLPVLFLMVLPGTAAILLYPHLDRADLVYPTLVFQLLPTGLIGLVVAGFLAAIMSSIASTFNSAATLVTMDFVARWRPGLSSRALVRVGRAATVLFMILAVAWVPVVESTATTLWQYLQSALSFAVPPVVALFFCGLFLPRANLAGARWGVAVGVVLGTVLFWGVQIAHVLPIHFLVAAAIIFAASCLAIIAGSATAAAPSAAQVEGLLWRPALWRAETKALAGVPAYANYRILSVALLAATAAIVWVFR